MARINVNVGRQRISRAMEPHEAGYVSNITTQMVNIRTNLKKIVDGIHGATPAAIKHGLQPIFDTSQVLVPVKTGKLKRSGFLEAHQTMRGASGSVGYAKSGNPHYAALVHERTEFYHAPPTQAKFLEEAVKRELSKVEPRIHGYMKGLLE